MLLPQPVIKCQYFITLRCCTDHSVAACNQCFKGIIIAELMMGFFLFFSLCCTLTLALSLPLHLSHYSLFLIFSGSPDHPSSMGGERLRSKLPPLRPDSQAREQVPCQICRWAVSVKSNYWSFECSYYYLITPGCRK